jgi:hypothetical protein
MNAYIKLSTNEYPRHIGDIELDPAGMADYVPVEWVDPPAHDPETQRCAESPPEQINGVWQMVWEMRDFTPEELQIRKLAFEEIVKKLNEIQDPITQIANNTDTQTTENIIPEDPIYSVTIL